MTNLGNLPHPVPPLVRMFVEERTWWGRASVDSLRETDEGDKARNYMDKLLHELRESLVPPVQIHVRSDVAELVPNSAAEMFLRLELPRELTPGRTYYGALPFLGGRLALTYDCVKEAPGLPSDPASIQA